MVWRNFVLASLGIYLPSYHRFSRDHNFELTLPSAFFRSGGFIILGGKAYYVFGGLIFVTARI
jgi:hypothetical protein